MNIQVDKNYTVIESKYWTRLLFVMVSWRNVALVASKVSSNVTQLQYNLNNWMNENVHGYTK